MQIDALVKPRKRIWDLLLKVPRAGCRLGTAWLGPALPERLLGRCRARFFVRFPVGLLAITATVLHRVTS